MARALLAAGSLAAAASASGEPPIGHEWTVGLTTGGAAFVHLFEWSWADVAKECEDFLGPKGFTAVQISPPNDHIQGGAWWTRYQPVTYNLTSRSGDEAGFADMVRRCAKVGVGIYADAVINHIAAGGGVSVAGSSYGNRASPIYSQEDMHHDGGNPGSNCQVNNYADKHNVQYCDLVGLPDLCTSCPRVQETIAAYLSRMADLGIAGIRIDAAKHQDAEELGKVLGRVKTELFVFQEVISGGGEGVHPDMYYKLGSVTEFNYARKVAPNFLDDGKLQYFGNFGEQWGLMPSDKAVVFLDNHDTQRGEAKLTYKNGKLYQLANIFMLAHPYGYPKVMSSYAFNDHDQGPPSTPVHNQGGVACSGSPSAGQSQDAAPWVCEHRWAGVANMVAWRRAAADAPVQRFEKAGADAVSFCRGSAACVALNRQESSTWSVTLKFSVPPGEYCDVIRSDDTSNCPVVQVAADGTVTLQVPPLGAVAVHVGKRRAAAATAVGSPAPGLHRGGASAAEVAIVV